MLEQFLTAAEIFHRFKGLANDALFRFAFQVFGFDGSTTIQEFSETINRVS